MTETAQTHAELVEAVIDLISSSKEKYIDEVTDASGLLVAWSNYLKSSYSNSICDELIHGIIASVQEVAVSLSLGLVRSSIFAIRSQMELLFAFIYYNDHSVEWASAQRSPSKFMMRGEFIKYMKANSDGFEKRLNFLDTISGRGKDHDLYGILSAHVHSTSAAATPKIEPLKNFVKSQSKCDEAVNLQRKVSEYLSDVLVSWLSDDWHDFPLAIKQNVQARLSGPDLAKLLS